MAKKFINDSALIRRQFFKLDIGDFHFTHDQSKSMQAQARCASVNQVQLQTTYSQLLWGEISISLFLVDNVVYLGSFLVITFLNSQSAY